MQNNKFRQQSKNSHKVLIDGNHGNVELKSIEFSEKICFGDINSVTICAGTWNLIFLNKHSLRTFFSIDDNKLNFGDLCDRSVDTPVLTQKIGMSVINFANGVLNNCAHLYLSQFMELYVMIDMQNSETNMPIKLNYNLDLETFVENPLFVPVKQFITSKFENTDHHKISQANNVYILANQKPQHVTFSTKTKTVNYYSKYLDSHVVSYENENGDPEYVYNFGQLDFYNEDVNVSSDVNDCTLVIQTTCPVFYRNGCVDML